MIVPSETRVSKVVRTDSGVRNSMTEDVAVILGGDQKVSSLKV
jgi:hypothetical protein